MPVSEAQKEAKKKYEAKAYDMLGIRVKKGERDRIKAFAEARDKSLNGFCKEAICSAMGEKAEDETTE
jgi:predicted HicB family RNase H-like nuclease